MGSQWFSLAGDVLEWRFLLLALQAWDKPHPPCLFLDLFCFFEHGVLRRVPVSGGSWAMLSCCCLLQSQAEGTVRVR